MSPLYFCRYRGCILKKVNFLKNISARLDIILEYKGSKILDTQTALLLKSINEYGSILLASKSVGIPYSRAWERIAKIERVLGVRIIERHRGGANRGGAKLTEQGLKLLEYYEKVAKKYNLDIRKPLVPTSLTLADIYVVAGSHDIAFEAILGNLKRKYSFNLEVHWIGSSGGLAALMLGEAVLASSHLFDKKSGEYNIPFLKNYWLQDRAIVIRGYMREIVFGFPRNYEFDELDDVISRLIAGELRLVNRNIGSGTRVLFDSLLRDYCSERGLDWEKCVRTIRGYDFEVNTHIGVAKAIVNGKADVGVLLKCAAEFYGLKTLHLRWEYFDFITLREKSGTDFVKNFIEELRSPSARNILGKYPGYRIEESIGRIIYPSRVH